MIRFPNCKINLGLRVTAKRSDGYHDIETIFFPVALRDVAEINLHQKKSSQSQSFELVTSGIPIPGSTDDNLCRKAYQILKNDHPQLPAVTMFLLKAIPIGAGLGGGSSDGASTLLLLNDLLQLNLSQAQLSDYALQLGSDCPFFIQNTPCHASGRGEIITPLELSLADHFVVIVDAGIHIQTGWAFGKIIPGADSVSLAELIKQPIIEWKDSIRNVFETPVFEAHPELLEIKQNLYQLGAVYASMTGTGSSIYGIFPNTSKPDLSILEARYRVFSLSQ